MAGSHARRGGRKTVKRRLPRVRNNVRLWMYLLFYAVLAAGLGYGIYVGYQALRTHPEFAVQTIEIAGATAKTERELRAELADLTGKNLFGLSLKNIQKRVEGHTWVNSAAVALQLPDKVRIAVRERIPAGIARVGNQVVLVGENGRIICPYKDYGAVLDLPVLIGLNANQPQPERIRRGLASLDQIRRTSLFFWENIETLDLSDEENMIVHLRSVDAPIHLGGKVIPANILNYLTIADHIARSYAALRYIELGFPDQVAIMPETP